MELLGPFWSRFIYEFRRCFKGLKEKINGVGLTKMGLTCTKDDLNA